MIITIAITMKMMTSEVICADQYLNKYIVYQLCINRNETLFHVSTFNYKDTNVHYICCR